MKKYADHTNYCNYSKEIQVAKYLICNRLNIFGKRIFYIQFTFRLSDRKDFTGAQLHHSR